jgi:lysophospholipase L1-like esterase
LSAIDELTPHMRQYATQFSDAGEVNWLPYLMYFHPSYFKSTTVSTDSVGFRYSEAKGERWAVANLIGSPPVRLIAGSSTVFGIGASADCHTLPSRLTQNDRRGERWVNFGGRSFNSTQELILFALNRHRLPKVKEIVLFSGFNDLGLARLPQRMRGEDGAFFMCKDFFDGMSKKRPSSFANWFTRGPQAGEPPDIETQIGYAAALTLRNADVWRALAADLGARLTFVLQPLANWVRSQGCREEQMLFKELERQGSFAQSYGDILALDNYRAYANRLAAGFDKIGVDFVDFSPILAEASAPDQWLFVDRIHFTDGGHDFVSKLLLRELEKGSVQ